MLCIPACLLMWHGSMQILVKRPTTADCLGLHPVGFIISPRMETPQLFWAEVCDHLDNIKVFSYVMHIVKISLRHFFLGFQLSQLSIVCQMVLIIIVGLCWMALVCLCLVPESSALTGLSTPGRASAVLRRKVTSLNLLEVLLLMLASFILLQSKKDLI